MRWADQARLAVFEYLEGFYTTPRRSRIAGQITGESRTPEEIREAVYLLGGDVGAKQSRFWLLLVLATGIATAGVVADSTATVIGAMIVAPLAVPIQGVAVGIAYGELRPLLLSAAIVLGAIVVVVALAAALGVVLPQLEAPERNSQITGRVSPSPSRSCPRSRWWG
jgi:uncharacterized membrane protein